MSSANRLLAIKKYSEFDELISSTSSRASASWEAEMSTGKVLEVATLFSVMNLLSDKISKVKVHDFLKSNTGLFYLRNEIPVHHGAQVGHLDSVDSEFSLLDRFVSSCLPRASFDIDGNSYMIFREGNPLHLLNSLYLKQDIYKDRPDIVIVRGSLEITSLSDKCVSFKHLVDSESCNFELGVKNSSLIPLRQYECTESYLVSTVGIIECSVSKTKKKVDSQLDDYIKLFTSRDSTPEPLFIHGGEEESVYSTVKVSTYELVKSLEEDMAKDAILDFLQKVISL